MNVERRFSVTLNDSDIKAILVDYFNKPGCLDLVTEEKFKNMKFNNIVPEDIMLYVGSKFGGPIYESDASYHVVGCDITLTKRG